MYSDEEGTKKRRIICFDIELNKLATTGSSNMIDLLREWRSSLQCVIWYPPLSHNE